MNKLVPVEKLQHLLEYWNGSGNYRAMWDALHHISNELALIVATPDAPSRNDVLESAMSAIHALKTPEQSTAATQKMLHVGPSTRPEIGMPDQREAVQPAPAAAPSQPHGTPTQATWVRKVSPKDSRVTLDATYIERYRFHYGDALCNQLLAAIDLQTEVERLTKKDGAYEERNKVVAALAKCFPSGRARTAIEGWSEDWHGCVYINLPTGQVSWHYHDSHAHLFDYLPQYNGKWDGHNTVEKYYRLSMLKSAETISVTEQQIRKICDAAHEKDSAIDCFGEHYIWAAREVLALAGIKIIPAITPGPKPPPRGGIMKLDESAFAGMAVK